MLALISFSFVLPSASCIPSWRTKTDPVLIPRVRVRRTVLLDYGRLLGFSGSSTGIDGIALRLQSDSAGLPQSCSILSNGDEFLCSFLFPRVARCISVLLSCLSLAKCCWVVDRLNLFSYRVFRVLFWFESATIGPALYRVSS